MPLGFHAQVTTHFLEGNFYRPPPDEPPQDVGRLGCRVNAQKRFRLKFPFWIAHEDPPQGDDGLA